MRKASGLAGGAGLFAASVSAMSVFAADLATRAPVYKAPVAPAFSWTGCYIGANAGGSSAKTDSGEGLGGSWLTEANEPIAAVEANGSSHLSMNGFTGGGQIGCNWQTGQFVLGIEADGEYLGLKGSAFAVDNNLGVTNNASISSHWLLTARPRAGFVVGQALVYATGGLAVGNLSFSDTQTYLLSQTSAAGSISSTKAGWTVGGGVEYAFDNHWIAGVEYLYADLGSASFGTTIQPPFPGLNFTNAFSANLKENLVRARLSYKF
jgi:outer membrane immunogenic protein